MSVRLAESELPPLWSTPETWPPSHLWASFERMGAATKLDDESFTPERRKHRVYVTRNTEYHFSDRQCVAVRDRRTGEFHIGHLAVRRQLQGGLRFLGNGGILANTGEPARGEALYFEADGRDLVTSPIERIERPERAIVARYPHLR